MTAGRIAEFWRSENGRVRCLLCPHSCVLSEGDVGLCHVRGSRDGALWATGYGEVSAVHVDPIEKKPIYHYLPGSRILSIGGWGCNLACACCQNWQLATSGVPDVGSQVLQPQELVELALNAGSPAVAYTYNEPLINLEYVRDCACACAKEGVGTVLVTNGFICPGPLAELLPLTQAANVDLKSLDDDFYRRLCGGRLPPVLQSIAAMRDAGVHVELTCLLIPGENSGTDRVGALAAWVAGALGRDVPLHLSAYFPCHRMSTPPTDEATLLAAHASAMQHLDYVFLGNTRLAAGRDSRCPACGTVLVARGGYHTRVCGIEDGACAACARPVDIVM